VLDVLVRLVYRDGAHGLRRDRFKDQAARDKEFMAQDFARWSQTVYCDPNAQDKLEEQELEWIKRLGNIEEGRVVDGIKTSDGQRGVNV
jgi:hypothetical protein